MEFSGPLVIVACHLVMQGICFKEADLSLAPTKFMQLHKCCVDGCNFINNRMQYVKFNRFSAGGECRLAMDARCCMYQASLEEIKLVRRRT
jgi:hypothetical protein